MYTVNLTERELFVLVAALEHSKRNLRSYFGNNPDGAAQAEMDELVDLRNKLRDV